MFDLYEVPRPLAEIEFQDETGKKYTLGQFHGNFALVNIWATWCPPCKEEMPSLNSLASHFSAKDLKIIPISVERFGSPNGSSLLYRIWLRQVVDLHRSFI